MVAGTFEYGVTGCAALSQDNLFASSFIPKSHTAGLTVEEFFELGRQMLVIPAIDLKGGSVFGCARVI